MKSNTQKSPQYSIVIPTLNEEKYLPDLLSDLEQQTNRNFEVIHADGNSDDKTKAIAKKYEKKLNLKTLTTEIRNVSVQRNMGISVAKGEWIIFMDADNRLKPSFLDGITYRLAENPETEVFSTWVSIDKEKSLNKPIERTINYWLEFGKLVGKEWAFGALIGVKRKILKKDLYFDSKQKVGEDGLFVKALVNAGHKFQVFKDPRYTYSVRRLDAEGTINLARKGALLSLNYVAGKDFSKKDFGYKMEGGSAYANTDYFNSYFNPFTLYNHISGATKKQIKQARDLFINLTKFDF